MAEEELNRAEILGPPVDQRRFRASQRMRAVGRGVQSNRGNPRSDDSRVLPGREVRRNATRKEELLRFEMGIRDPGSDRVSCLLGDLELHRSLAGFSRCVIRVITQACQEFSRITIMC